MKTAKQRQNCVGVFIVNFEHISDTVQVYAFSILNS